MAAAKDDFPGLDKSLNAPVHNLVAVTPSDDELTNGITKGLHIGATGGSPPAAGNIVVTFARQNTSVTIRVNTGQYYPYRVRKVHATGMTADLVVHAAY